MMIHDASNLNPRNRDAASDATKISFHVCVTQRVFLLFGIDFYRIVLAYTSRSHQYAYAIASDRIALMMILISEATRDEFISEEGSL